MSLKMLLLALRLLLALCLVKEPRLHNSGSRSESFSCINAASDTYPLYILVKIVNLEQMHSLYIHNLIRLFCKSLGR